MGAALAHSRPKMQCLECFNKKKSDFVHQFIKTDETWIHYYTPESKQQSKQWTEADCLAPKSIPSSGKVMASVFWDAKGVLYIDCLEKDAKIAGEYYFNLLSKLDEKFVKKIWFAE